MYPNITPTRVENKTAITIENPENIIEKLFEIELNPQPIKSDKTIPTIPPIKHIKTASNKNYCNIFFSFAPIAILPFLYQFPLFFQLQTQALYS